MEHNDAVRMMAAEKYLLGELPPDVRDSFEEHFFTCQDCASEVRASAAFVQHTKRVLAVKPTTQTMPVAAPAKPGWLGWLRPAFVLPVMALLLAVVGYQNLVTYPALKGAEAELRTPQIFPSASLINSNSRGGSTPSVKIRSGEPFLLFVDIPGDNRYSSYVAELQRPDGTPQWSLNIPPETTKETVPIRVPAGITTGGQYALIVRGVTATGESAEVGRYPFILQLR